MVVYFSGTGNSRYCAQMLAQKLGDELLDASDYIRHGIAAELFSEKPWVFAAPTYAWQMARVFAEFIRSGSFEGAREAYFILTCGGDAGDAASGIEELCRGKELRCMGVQEVVMPENYVAMFSVPDEERCARIIADARPVLEQCIGRICAGEPFPSKKAGLLDKLKSGPVNRGFYACYVKADHFYATDSCIGCGACERVCVLQNISFVSERPVWGDQCTHCMACISGCPVRAIEYGRRSEGKRRYRCPEYTE